MSVFQIASGAILMLIVLLDVFLTVLFARAGAGIFTPWVNIGAWSFFRSVAGLFGRRAGLVMSMCGPATLVLMVFIWAVLLTTAAALIIEPYLGSAITTDIGPTPTGFVSALFTAGISMSIVGTSGFMPRTSTFRL